MSRILVIEDDEQTRRMLRQMIERAGYEVEDAGDGLDAIKRMHARPADLVITDLLMPEKDGIETIQELRRDFPDVPVIAISGGGRNGVFDFLPIARQLGATHTFTKPTDRRKLLSAVEEALGVGVGSEV